MSRYQKRVDQRFLSDLNYIKTNHLVDPNDWELFKEQLRKELAELDGNWETSSRETVYPPLSTYHYRKRYMHSIPLRVKKERGWKDLKSDFRIIFKVREVEIYYFGIGKRIKTYPKDPVDIWAQIKKRTLPEDEAPPSEND